MPAALPAMARLKRRSEYLAVARGTRVPRRGFLMQALHRPGQMTTRHGFTVTKKQGNAVERNRIRRRLVAAVEAVAPLHAPAGYDIVLVGRRDALGMAFDRLTSDLAGAYGDGARGGRRRPAGGPTNSKRAAAMARGDGTDG